MDNSVYNHKRTIITALVIFVIDAFVMNQGGIAAILIMAIVFWWLPKSAIFLFKRQSPKIQLTKSIIYGITALCVFGANTINNKIAENRAEQLIHNIEQYHQANSKYPDKLADLVPTYISRVPLAKYTFVFSEFVYFNQDENASIFYFALPPFGRPTYNFNNKSWIYHD